MRENTANDVLGASIGDKVIFSNLGEDVVTILAGTYEPSLWGPSESVIFPRGTLEEQPHSYLFALESEDSQSLASFHAAVSARYPEVPV